ncbi:PAS domain-containing protein [Devosia epidermidihirudinis]|uniref:PAS domain-containing protein n=1 Tax=Devosia epidermidihirudinis TaxID=1293439 RepID=UPI000698B336|nr:PAS domain-containing protein [Devosia epidermidihirudinis]
MPRSLFPAASPEVRARLEQSPTLKLINDFDWATSLLGPIPDWPESLKGAIRVMMAAASPMVMMVGPDGVLIYNDSYAEFAGERHPAIFGQPALEAWPEIADFNADKIAMGLRGETIVLRDQELVLNRHGQPESGWMDLHYSPILNNDGLPLGTLCLVHETTDRIMAERALARSEERLSLALGGSTLIGTWDWDVTRNIVTADDKFAQLYNLDPLHAGLGLPMDDLLNVVHPDDAERVRVDIQAALNGGGHLNTEYRVVSPITGETHWVIATGRARLDAEGRAERFPGVVVDVSEQRRVAAALEESELRFRTLANTMPQMVWSTLSDGTHDYYNDRWYEFTGLAREQKATEGWVDVYHPDDQERAAATWQHSLATGEEYKIEHRLRHNSGDYRWTLGLALPVRDQDGRVVRWFGTLTDIHETRLAAEERELVAQELSHRIKNIFAVLIGIVSLSARSRPEVKSFADELRQRIYALGEAHDFVRPHHQSRPPENQGSLRSLLERLLSPYREIGQERVTFIGEDAEIDDGAATPLALLFHELATNSAKYGAFSSGDGSVSLTGATEGDKYRLVWKEHGGPAVVEDTETIGFGTRVINLSVEGQLRGQVTRLWEPDGLRVDIVVPVDALRRSARLQSQVGT